MFGWSVLMGWPFSEFAATALRAPRAPWAPRAPSLLAQLPSLAVGPCHLHGTSNSLERLRIRGSTKDIWMYCITEFGDSPWIWKKSLNWRIIIGTMGILSWTNSVGGAMRQGWAFSLPTCSLILHTHPVANRICDGTIPDRRLRMS